VLAEDVRCRDRFAEDGDGAAPIMNVIDGRQEELLEAAVPVGERLYAEPAKPFA
jgi:hypothetical protein